MRRTAWAICSPFTADNTSKDKHGFGKCWNASQAVFPTSKHSGISQPALPGNDMFVSVVRASSQKFNGRRWVLENKQPKELSDSHPSNFESSQAVFFFILSATSK